MATEIFHELLQCSVIDVVDHNGRVTGDFLSHILGHSMAHLTQAYHILRLSAQALRVRMAMEVDRTYEAISRSLAVHNCGFLEDRQLYDYTTIGDYELSQSTSHMCSY